MEKSARQAASETMRVPFGAMSEALGRRRFLAVTGVFAGAGLVSMSGSALAAGSVQPRLIERLDRPLDLETPTRYFTTYLTPNDLFFVRSHFGAPDPIDPTLWRLRIGGEVGRSLSLGLADLRRFPEVSVVSLIQCSGNGRAFFRPRVAGVQWQRGAVGVARWTGVRLADVLRHAGLKPAGSHVWLRGRDHAPLPTVPLFIRSIPLAVALAPQAILAYEMNGAPLPLLHGQPVRVIVPGWVADDQVKWLSEIQVQPTEPQGFYYQVAYRFPNHPGKPGVAVLPKDTHPLALMNVKSLIAQPEDGTTLARGATLIRGVAWSGNTTIERVDVSVDGGKTSMRATIEPENSPYAWRLWRLEHRFDRPGSYTITARATDSRGATQPPTAVWNPSGYMYNAPDTATVQVR